MRIKLTDGQCVFCKGQIVEKITIEYDPLTGPLVLGPGGKGQFKEIGNKYHCRDCGLKYEFIPKKPN